MELKKTKRSIVVLAAALATISTSVMAESTSKAVRLSDAELDAITASGAQVVVSNSGNAEVLMFKENKHGVHGVCVNCEGVLPSPGPAIGVVTVENPGREPFFKFIGKPHFPF